MVVFLADRSRLDNRRLHHHRLVQRIQRQFTAVRVARADRRDPGPFRVFAESNAPAYLGDSSYPVTDAKLSIGFDVEQTASPFDHYWINWLEPSRSLLVGWHQDDTHTSLGEVHVQVTHGDTTVAREPAQFIDKHPLAVLEARLDQLPALVHAVEWTGDGATGINW